MVSIQCAKRIWLLLAPMLDFVPSVTGSDETKLQKKIRTQAERTDYRYGHPLHSADPGVDSRRCYGRDFCYIPARFTEWVCQLG